MLRFIRSPCGHTLTELMAVLIIITVLGCTGAASYAGYVDKAKMLRAKYELNLFAPALDLCYIENGRYPADPSQAGIIWPCANPWGKPYGYRSNGDKYVITAPDGDGRYRLEARGEAGASEVVEQTDDIRAVEEGGVEEQSR